MIFFFQWRYFSTSNSSGQATFCTYSRPEYKGDGRAFVYIFLFSLFSIIFFFQASSYPEPRHGLPNLMLIFSVLICFINLEMLWHPSFRMKGVCGVTFSIHGLCNFSHLLCASRNTCCVNKVEHRNSNGFSKYRGSSFQILSFKHVIKPNSPNGGKDLNGSRCSVFCRG